MGFTQAVYGVSPELCRDDTSTAFEAGVRNFESWCHVLLLDAWQRAGLFTEPGISATVAEIAKLNSRAGVVGALGHVRMVQAALDILVSSGLLRHASALPHQSLQLRICSSYGHC